MFAVPARRGFVRRALIAGRKGAQATASVSRAIVRPPAGRLKKQHTPAAVSNVTIDAMSGITVVAAIHIPIRNGAKNQCSTFMTIAITLTLPKSPRMD